MPARRAGAYLSPQCVGAEIARLGGRRARDRDALTPTESRTAGGAAEGRSNREIAATLFLSERTAEANPMRSHRKPGVGLPHSERAACRTADPSTRVARANRVGFPLSSGGSQP
jgi:DNA-binding CsgD family transcriptional regulator